jgi:hypothetical protein
MKLNSITAVPLSVFQGGRFKSTAWKQLDLQRGRSKKEAPTTVPRTHYYTCEKELQPLHLWHYAGEKPHGGFRALLPAHKGLLENGLAVTDGHMRAGWTIFLHLQLLSADLEVTCQVNEEWWQSGEPGGALVSAVPRALAWRPSTLVWYPSKWKSQSQRAGPHPGKLYTISRNLDWFLKHFRTWQGHPLKDGFCPSGSWVLQRPSPLSSLPTETG